MVGKTNEMERSTARASIVRLNPYAVISIIVLASVMALLAQARSAGAEERARFVGNAICTTSRRA